MMELQLKDGIQELSQVRNCLVMELQHLQEAKPALEKAYAVRNQRQSCHLFYCFANFLYI